MFPIGICPEHGLVSDCVMENVFDEPKCSKCGKILIRKGLFEVKA